MKRLTMVLSVCLILGALAFVAACSQGGDNPKGTKTRIGTFDSRAVALAFWHSDEGKKQIDGIFEEHKKAKAAKDEKRVKQLAIEGPGLQVRMHQQVFSTGSVTDIVEKIKAKLPQIAKDAGVSLIIPKWQIAYRDPSVEYVDVTPQLVKLFNPADKTLKAIEELRKQEPIPIEKMSYDPKD
jgi:Skp family chaperone for outer membrane proteins